MPTSRLGTGFHAAARIANLRGEKRKKRNTRIKTTNVTAIILTSCDEIYLLPYYAAYRSGERTRPRVQFPASRRKTLFGETPNNTRGTRMLPRRFGGGNIWEIFLEEASAAAWRRAHRSCSCDLDSEVVGKVFDLHFFCRGNSILFHHLILAQKIVGLHLFTKAGS